jgi:tetratricopeptide (TPR) repeat protein
VKIDRRKVALGAALLVGTFLLFSRAIGNDFVNYDDPIYVTENKHVQVGFSLAAIRWAFTSGDAANWHPLTWLSHILDWSLFGDDPRGHHAINVGWHAVNAVLAFLLFMRLTSALWPAVFTAALFAWHPLRVESVAWIAERKDVLSGFFALLVLWAYTAYGQKQGRDSRSAGKYYAIALIGFSLALLCKPMLVTLPCIMFLIDFWPLRRLRAASAVRLLTEKLPFVVLAAASCAVTLFVQRAGGAVAIVLPLRARLANAAVATLAYVNKFVWPQDLAVLYPHPGFWPSATVALALLFVIGTSVLALFQARRRPWLTVGWFWFLIMLLPVIGLVQVGLQFMADRYTYLPILGLHLALVCTAQEFTKSRTARRALAIAATAALLACAAQTWRQLGVWENSLTLFDHALALTKNNYLAFNNRGLYFARVGANKQAIADYQGALAINPHFAPANNNLGEALAEKGRPRDGIFYFRAALESDPGLLAAQDNLGNALADSGEPEEALQHYDFVLRRDPTNVAALSNSGIAFAMLRRFSEALCRLEEAVRQAPDDAGVLRNLARTRAMMSDPTSRDP